MGNDTEREDVELPQVGGRFRGADFPPSAGGENEVGVTPGDPVEILGETEVTPEKQAVDVAVEALRYLVLAVQREGDRMLVGILRPFGLTPSQAEVLAVLAEYAPISLAELGRLLVCEAGSPSRLVDSLVRKGLVYRRHSRTDRRSVQLQLTSAGFARLASLQAPADVIIQAVAQRLDPDERITLATLLSKLLVGLPTEGVIARRFGWPPGNADLPGNASGSRRE